MSILAADDLSLVLGKKTIFEHAGFAVDRGDRLGVIGPNGSGKSSLLRVLVGEITPDGGRVTSSRGVQLGYLPQELSELGSGTLLEQTLAQAPGRSDVEQRITQVEERLESSTSEDEQLELAEALAELHTRAAELDRWYAPHRAEQILAGLGFEIDAFSRPITELSGGWRMRAALAGLLFRTPDVLILDEPTNHLDMPSVAWLNRFLDSYRASMILICHDREFLNRHINRVVSFEVEGLRTYRGNYNEYLEQRALELELLENRAKKDEQRKKELDAFVTRFRAKASKARQAQSKAKMLEKMQDRVVELPRARKTMAVRFKPVERSGDIVMRLENVGYAYGESKVFDDANLLVRRGERIAIVGVNGAGKTTLLRVVAEELANHKGKVELGTKVKLRYYAQHHTEVLIPENSVETEVSRAAPALSHTEVRTLLGAFLFSGDEVEKPVGVLSGGERARVALARLLADPGNVLLLDEPTNHLDVESAEKLTDSLTDYQGTLLFVSHNLAFAKRLSTKVWNVANGRVEEYPGSLGEYLSQFTDEEPEETDAPKAPVSKAQRKKDREEKKKREAAQRKKKSQVERNVAELEAKIAALEVEQSEVETELADPETLKDGERTKALNARYETIRAEAKKTLAAWEAAAEVLESLGASDGGSDGASQKPSM